MCAFAVLFSFGLFFVIVTLHGCFFLGRYTA